MSTSLPDKIAIARKDLRDLVAELQDLVDISASFDDAEEWKRSCISAGVDWTSERPLALDALARQRDLVIEALIEFHTFVQAELDVNAHAKIVHYLAWPDDKLDALEKILYKNKEDFA